MSADPEPSPRRGGPRMGTAPWETLVTARSSSSFSCPIPGVCTPWCGPEAQHTRSPKTFRVTHSGMTQAP